MLQCCCHLLVIWVHYTQSCDVGPDSHVTDKLKSINICVYFHAQVVHTTVMISNCMKNQLCWFKYIQQSDF